MSRPPYPLSPTFLQNLAELTLTLDLSPKRGGFILTGISGPIAKEKLKEELKKRLASEFQVKTVFWPEGVRDLIQLFAPDDAENTVYLVEYLEKALIEAKTSTYSLLNFTREFYSRVKRWVIYLLPADFVYQGVHWFAPDFWSIRAGIFDFFMDEDFTLFIQDKLAQELSGYPKEREELSLLLDFLEKEKQSPHFRTQRRVDLLWQMSLRYKDLGQYRDALAAAGEALKFRQHSQEKQNAAYLLGVIGEIHALSGQAEAALTSLEEALAIFRQLGNKEGELQMLHCIGQTLCNLNQLPKAMDCFQQGLFSAQESGDKRGEAFHLGGTGVVYNLLNQPQPALTYLQQALEIWMQLADKKGEALQLSRIGTSYRLLGKLPKALTHLLHALELTRQLEYGSAKPDILHQLGLTYIALGEKEKAHDFLQEALDIYRQIGNKQKVKAISLDFAWKQAKIEI